MPPPTAKERGSRLPDHNYFKTPDDLTRVKLRWTRWVALGLSVPLLVWLALFLTTGLGASFVSPGRVAAVHAAWEHSCNDCHQAGHDIHVRDNCKNCHGGPYHYKDQSDAANRCADCHDEHRGRDASLVRPGDAVCTRCHRDLEAVKPGSAARYHNSITAFARDHPLEARSVRLFDPDQHRTLKFSHAVHLSEGMARDPKAMRLFRLGDIADKTAQPRYQALQKKEGPNAEVKLECQACHRLDAADFGFPAGALAGLPEAALLPHRAAGGNPLPITYDAQCKACHPLTFDDKEPPAPHRVQPAALQEQFERLYAGRLFQDQLPLQKLNIRRDGRLDRPEDLGLREARAAVRDTTAAALGKVLSQGPNACAKCHLFDRPTPPAPAPVRTLRAHDVWYKHARFTHLAHRSFECKKCHAGAYPEATDASQPPAELETALVPEVTKCQECHGPDRPINGQPTAGARFDCVECHRYHNGEAPLQGIGAAARDRPVRNR
jgi:predicted CXXCH cytochrome family protein